MSAKIRKSQATIYLLGTSAQIYTIANLKVPLLYIFGLSELKLNENSEHYEVVMYQNMLACLNPFSFQVVSGNILYAPINGLPQDGGCGKPQGNLTFSGFRMSISPPLGLH